MSILNRAAPRKTTASIAERATNAATQLAIKNVRAAIPQGVRQYLPLARSFMTGGVNGLLDAGMNELFANLGLGGTLLPTLAGNGGSRLMGGLTKDEALAAFREHQLIQPASRKLWNIRIRNVQGGLPLDINMFALDVSYSGAMVQGDAVIVGSGSFDNVTTSDRREVRMTTFDDEYGQVKRWFMERHDRMCHKDGTFGLPIDYVFHVDILHAFINKDQFPEAYMDSYLMRPGSIDYDLSRRDDGLSELQMTFTQWDTFGALS